MWDDIRAGASNSDIWGSRYDPYLNSWSPPQRIDDATGTTAQLSPTVAFTATETMVGWRDNRLSANGDTQARRFVFLPGLTDHFALAYDGLNRLKSLIGPVSESFTFDEASNIAARTGPSQTNSYDLANRLTSDGTLNYTWSDADRLATRGSDSFTFDPLDRLTTSSIGGTTRSYGFNGDGLLQNRTQGATTSLLWDPMSTVSRLLKLGADSIVYGLGPLYAVRSDGSTVTFARDASKNVRAEVSNSGITIGAWRYRSYGDVAAGATAARPTYLGLASQLLDASGLYYMRARWYDPAVGRFISRDPLRGSAMSPASLNSYSYAAADPIGRADPTGLNAEGHEHDGIGGSLISNLVATGAAVIGEQIPTWTTSTDTMMSRGVIVGSSSRSAVGAPVVLIETAQTVERVAPIFQFAKRLLSNPLTGGLVGGAAQAWEDSGRSLTTAQRIDRVAIAAGIGVTVAAVGVVAIAAGAPLLFVAGGLVVLGVTADLIAKPWIFERRGYGR